MSKTNASIPALNLVVDAMVTKYPMLYASTSRELSTMLVLGQIFNTIGGGFDNVRDLKNLQEAVAQMRKHGIQEAPSYYFDDTPLFEGFLEKSTGRHRTNYHTVYGAYPEERKHIGELMGVSEWRPLRKNKTYSYYPNFKKEYSFIWKIEPSVLPTDWLQWVTTFYEQAKSYFESEQSRDYHYAWPSDPQKQARVLKDFQGAFERYADYSEEERNALVTKDYGTEYKGDLPDFLERKWMAERGRILDFIEETLARVTHALAVSHATPDARNDLQ